MDDGRSLPQNMNEISGRPLAHEVISEFETSAASATTSPDGTNNVDLLQALRQQSAPDELISRASLAEVSRDAIPVGDGQAEPGEGEEGGEGGKEGGDDTPPPAAAKVEVPRPSDFELLRMVGKGAYGKVLQVRLRSTGQLYAMKVIEKQEVIAQAHVEYTRAERHVMTQVDHPFLVRLRCAFQTADKLFLVMDYLPGGELFMHLGQSGMLLEDAVRVYAAEMVLALEHLHHRGIIHRDLKPENVLLDTDGHLRLTDYGLAKVVRREDMPGGGEAAAGANEKGPARTICGTNEYMAPEMVAALLKRSRERRLAQQGDDASGGGGGGGDTPGTPTTDGGEGGGVSPAPSTQGGVERTDERGNRPPPVRAEGYGASVDWWSLGALIYEMLTGRPPFQAQDEQKLYRKILQERIKLPRFLSPACHSLLRGLLERNVEKRLGCGKSTLFTMRGVAAIKQHPFFSSIDWPALERKEIPAPIKLDLAHDADTRYFDPEFTSLPTTDAVPDPTVTVVAEDTLGPQDPFSGFAFVDPTMANKLLEAAKTPEAAPARVPAAPNAPPNPLTLPGDLQQALRGARKTSAADEVEQLFASVSRRTSARTEESKRNEHEQALANRPQQENGKKEADGRGRGGGGGGGGGRSGGGESTGKAAGGGDAQRRKKRGKKPQEESTLPMWMRDAMARQEAQPARREGGAPIQERQEKKRGRAEEKGRGGTKEQKQEKHPIAAPRAPPAPAPSLPAAYPALAPPLPGGDRPPASWAAAAAIQRAAPRPLPPQAPAASPPPVPASAAPAAFPSLGGSAAPVGARPVLRAEAAPFVPTGAWGRSAPTSAGAAPAPASWAGSGGGRGATRPEDAWGGPVPWR